MDSTTPTSPRPPDQQITTDPVRSSPVRSNPARSASARSGPVIVDGSREPTDQLRIDTQPTAGSRDEVRPIEVSVVVPVYRSADTLTELCQRISQTFALAGRRFEILLVEDCGGDNTWEVCTALADDVADVRALRLRRNFGQHNALLCGIREARGDVIVTLDDDLQNPPEEIPRLLEPIDEGFDVVYGVPEVQKTTWSRRLSSIVAKRAIQQIGGFEAAPEVNSYRAFRADLARAFDDYRSPHVNIDVLLSWGTERYTSRTVRHEPRTVGQSGYSTFKLIRHALNMITGFSTSPLKVASLAGFGTGMLGVLMMVYVIGSYLLSDQSVPGFAFLASSVAMFSGVQLFTIGILGEYLGRLYFGTMGKPDYVVAERLGSRPGRQTVEYRPSPFAQPSQRATRSHPEREVAPPVEPKLGSAPVAPERPLDGPFEPRSAVVGRVSLGGNRPSLTSWAIVIAAMVAVGTLLLLTSQDLWFYADTWPFLADRSWDPWSWRQPHGGHLLVPATGMLQGLFATVGMDFYPWYFLPRVVLAAVGGLAWWRVARWRGVDPVVSLLVAVLFSGLGVSAWLVTVSYSGPLLIMLCALVAALMVEGWEPTSRPRLVLGAVLTLAVITSSGSGPAVWLATAIMMTAVGRLRRYAWPIAAPGALYLAWYLLIARHDPNPIAPDLPSLVDLVLAPFGMVPHIGAAVAALFGSSPTWSWPAAGAYLVAVAALVWLGRLGRFECTLLLSGLIIAGLGVVVRQAQGIDVNAPNRMHLLVLYLVLPLLVAGLRDLRVEWRIAAAIVLGSLVALNLVTLLDGIDMRERIRTTDRPMVETTAALLAQGEPAIGWTSTSPQAHHRHLQVLVDRGWQGELHPELVPDLLVQLKTGFFVVDQPFGTPPAAPQLTVGPDGCAPLPPGEQRLQIGGEGAIVVHGAADSLMTLGWQEDGVRSVIKHQLTEPSHGVAYTRPKSDQPATLTIDGSWPVDGVTICGLAVDPRPGS